MIMTAKKGTKSKAQQRTEIQERLRVECEERQRKLEAAATVDNMWVKLSVEDNGDGYSSNLVAEGEIGFYECTECHALTSSDVAAINHADWHDELKTEIANLYALVLAVHKLTS